LIEIEVMKWEFEVKRLFKNNRHRNNNQKSQTFSLNQNEKLKRKKWIQS
jgi:hypothetical protein